MSTRRLGWHHDLPPFCGCAILSLDGVTDIDTILYIIYNSCTHKRTKPSYNMYFNLLRIKLKKIRQTYFIFKAGMTLNSFSLAISTLVKDTFFTTFKLIPKLTTVLTQEDIITNLYLHGIYSKHNLIGVTTAVADAPCPTERLHTTNHVWLYIYIFYVICMLCYIYI